MGVERRRLTCLVMSLVVLTACTSERQAARVPAAPPAAVGPVDAAVLRSDDPYARAVDAAHARGLEVWLSADLVRRWLEGPAALRSAVARLRALEARRGVAGIKIADELGKDDGLRTLDGANRFLADSAALIRASMPGARIMIDLYVPQLGCGPDLDVAAALREACAAKAQTRYPSLTLPAVEVMLRSGHVDVLNLSTGLLEDTTYAAWGLTQQQVQRAAWQTVRARGWDRLVTLFARKALAHEGSYLGSAAAARRDLDLFVERPLAGGARAVDVWTWRQPYRGSVVRLADPGPAPNELWRQLVARHDAGQRLLTHFTPTSTEQGIDQDLDFLAQAFRGVLIAAGTG
jgi:hypothetical protein